jgi:hypothetical protein
MGKLGSAAEQNRGRNWGKWEQKQGFDEGHTQSTREINSWGKRRNETEEKHKTGESQQPAPRHQFICRAAGAARSDKQNRGLERRAATRENPDGTRTPERSLVARRPASLTLGDSLRPAGLLARGIGLRCL